MHCLFLLLLIGYVAFSPFLTVWGVMAPTPTWAAAAAGSADPDSRSRTVTPSFANNVPPEVRQAVTNLLNAYLQGDGNLFISLTVVDEKDPSSLANSINMFQIPLKNVKVNMAKKNILTISYQMPLPEDIIAVIITGKEDVNLINKNTMGLIQLPNLMKKTETWEIVRQDNAIRINYRNKGIFKFSQALSNDIEFYQNNQSLQKTMDEVVMGSLSIRATLLLSEYFIIYDIDPDSAEFENTTLGMIQKMGGQGTEKTPPLEKTREVVFPPFSFRIPASFIDVKKIPGVTIEKGVAFAGGDSPSSYLVIFLKEEFDVTDKKFSNYRPDLMLLAFFATVLERFPDSIEESGDSEVGGVPAKFTKRISRSKEDSDKIIYSYYFIHKRKIYNLSFGMNKEGLKNNEHITKDVMSSFKIK